METITIATLAKLFVIKIVAKRSFGFSMCFKTLCEDFDLVLLSFSKSDGDRLKKATSEPEIRAEQISNIIVITNATTTPVVSGLKIVRSCPNSNNELAGSKFI